MGTDGAATRHRSEVTILVTNTADSGAGSLRQAIADANANAGTDAINFQAGLTGTITLSRVTDIQPDDDQRPERIC